MCDVGGMATSYYLCCTAIILAAHRSRQMQVGLRRQMRARQRSRADNNNFASCL